MQIFLKNLNGTKVMNVNNTDSVENLMSVIEKTHGIAAEDQLLIFSGRVLKQSNTFAELNMSEGSTIDFSLKLLGGAGDQMDPAFIALVEKYIYNKKICRRCFGTNSIKARVCRKRKCGHCGDLRLKKQLKAK